MNSCTLIGRLTRDPEVRYSNTANGQMAIARFSLAINRPSRNGEESKADFPNIVAFGKTAENCEKYLRKGARCAVKGHLQTGSYKHQDGHTVYTTDVVAENVEFIDFATQETAPRQSDPYGASFTPRRSTAVDNEPSINYPQYAFPDGIDDGIDDEIDAELPF